MGGGFTKEETFMGKLKFLLPLAAFVLLALMFAIPA
jgi:hypothetical protein